MRASSDEPFFVELLDLARDVDEVVRVAAEDLLDAKDGAGSDRAVAASSRVADVNMVVGMPDAVAMDAPAADDDIALEVCEPPRQHARRDVLQHLVADPEAGAAVGQFVHAAGGRAEALQSPGKRDWRRHSAKARRVLGNRRGVGNDRLGERKGLVAAQGVHGGLRVLI